ncbi:MAG: urea transporter [Proteobacteria bacterium]|nr:urea transporter [Pseudomonadota bacterium]
MKTRWWQRGKRLAQGILASYGAVYFCDRRSAALLFAAATFIVPFHGLLGLLGLAFANTFAWLLRRPPAVIQYGTYGFNGLLVGLALGLFFRCDLPLVFFLAVISFMTVVVTEAMRLYGLKHQSVPALSWPFIIVTLTALLSAHRYGAVEITVAPIWAAPLGAAFVPHWIAVYLRSLGCAFFQLSVVSGALVALGLLLYSRWALILSALGFVCGTLTYRFLGGDMADITHAYIGFNFVLTAIAVGGIWVVLSPASLLFAAGASALAAILSAAMLALLTPLELPVLALPFVTATQLAILASRVQAPSLHLQPVFAPRAPEENLAEARGRLTRFPAPHTTLLLPPFHGTWTVTQGFHGAHTHQGQWPHGLDFEILDEGGSPHRGLGHTLDDYHTYKAPVLACGSGTVVHVVDHLGDNPVGEIDTHNPYGNCVVIAHAGGVFSLVAHLQQHSIAVRIGDVVYPGQPLAKVGNSGRSPRPHLHLQAQAAPHIGSPTVPFALLHALAHDGDVPRYHTHVVPGENTRISPMPPSDWVRRAAQLMPGQTWRWHIAQQGRTRTEQWTSTVDPTGVRRLQSDAGASVEFYADTTHTAMYNFRGSGQSLLGLFFLACARLPHTGTDATWDDQPGARDFLPPFARLWHDAALPFATAAPIRTASTLQITHRDVQVHCRVEARSFWLSRMPDDIQVTLLPDTGLHRLRATRRGALLLEAWTDP